MGFLLILILIILLCYSYSAPTRYDAGLGRASAQEALYNRDKAYRSFAEDNNCYYDGDKLNACFYPDGSLKYDQFTKQSYERGKYYANSKGTTANYGMMRDPSQHAPK